MKLPVMSRDFSLSDFNLRPNLEFPLDATALKDFVDCPSRFYLRHVLGLKLKGVRKPHFSWGSRWHEVLEVWHKNYSVDEAFKMLAMDWPEDLDPMEERGRTLDRMVLIFTDYLKRFQNEDEDEWETIRTEQFFTLKCTGESSCPFGGCGLEWSGRIDRIANHKVRGIYDWDYKTTSRLRKSAFVEFKKGFQIPGYVWGMMHIIPGASRPNAIVELLHTTKTKHEIFRYPIRYTLQELLEWIDNVKRILDDIRMLYECHADKPWMWTKNWNDCHRLWRCDYWPIHGTPDIKDTRLRIAQQDYIVERWDPSNV